LKKKKQLKMISVMEEEAAMENDITDGRRRSN
jgi:hypothetical protein